MLTEVLLEIQRKKLKEKGFRGTEVTMGAAEACLKGILCAAPFSVFLTGVYHWFLLPRAVLPDISGIGFYMIPASILGASGIIHEALHGIGWAVIGRAGWHSVTFHRNGVFVSCSCCLVLTKDAYLAGILLPVIATGIFCTLFLAIYPGTISLLTMLANFALAGTDLVISVKILKSDAIFIAGHPQKTGFTGYRM